jgi:hypothetical protein
MFNLKKKIVDSFKDPNVLIAEIHEEFDSSTERLLSEAKEILSKSDTNKIAKADRLKSIGFSSAKTVAEAQQQVNDVAKSKELSENIMYFKQWYPFNKFINEAEVERICKKYGLLCGEASKYIGDIPEKNLSEIEGFKLRQEDMVVRYSPNYSIDRIMYEQQMLWERRLNEQTQRNALMASNSFGNLLGGVSSIGNSINSVGSSAPIYSALEQANFGEREKTHVKPEFKICAPVKDFDTKWMRVEDGYKLSNVPDPIVLQPVKGGYLIVSKWGLEGEDKELVNEVLN